MVSLQKNESKNVYFYIYINSCKNKWHHRGQFVFRSFVAWTKVFFFFFACFIPMFHWDQILLLKILFYLPWNNIQQQIGGSLLALICRKCFFFYRIGWYGTGMPNLSLRRPNFRWPFLCRHFLKDTKHLKQSCSL